MTRRTFIGIVAGVAVVALARCYFWWRKRRLPNDIIGIAALPQLLSQVAAEEDIKEIANAVKPEPCSIFDECDLTAVILKDVPESVYSPVLYPNKLMSILADKVQLEFQQNKIKIVNGWILSETEVMQCQSYAWLSDNS